MQTSINGLIKNKFLDIAAFSVHSTEKWWRHRNSLMTSYEIMSQLSLTGKSFFIRIRRIEYVFPLLYFSLCPSPMINQLLAYKCTITWDNQTIKANNNNSTNIPTYFNHSSHSQVAPCYIFTNMYTNVMMY